MIEVFHVSKRECKPGKTVKLEDGVTTSFTTGSSTLATRRRIALGSLSTWALVAPYPTLMDEEAPSREHSLRDVFNALRWMVRAGAPWRLLPNDFPPWSAVYQQSQRWIVAGVFEKLVHDLRALLRISTGRSPQPTAAIFDGCVMQSTPESGARAGDDGHKRKKGSKFHIAVDTLGDLLVTIVTAAKSRSEPRSQHWRPRFKR